MNIQEAARTLAIVMAESAKLHNEREKLLAALEFVPAWLALKANGEKLAMSTTSEDRAKADLRRLMVDAFDSSDVKDFPGIGKVAMYEVIEYDPVLAVAWAVGKQELSLLQIDRKKFDPVAKALQPNFVTVRQEPRARIDSKIKPEAPDAN